ncbi:MAG: sel1 repeat family protein, partial [Alistipes sp.]|nr:sel1 repeat family protein [Alistipes sp.]
YGDKAVLRFEGSFKNKDILINIDMRQCELKYLSSLNDGDHINSIGVSYYEERKYQEAYPYFVRAAHMGEAAALYNLGMMYHFGKGVAKDYEAAKDYYEQACEQKYPLAYNNLGSLYYNGTYVKQDYIKAFDLFMKAAERGIENAQFTVASMLYHGDGVNIDKPAARKWFEKAAAQGSREAKKYLDSWIN